MTLPLLPPLPPGPSIDKSNVFVASIVRWLTLVQTTLNSFFGSWTDISSTISTTGFSGTPTITLARALQIGKTVFFNIQITGTSNSTSFTITGLPVAACVTKGGIIKATDNSAAIYTAHYGTTANSNILTFYNSNSSTGWTNSGTKATSCSGFYETL